MDSRQEFEEWFASQFDAKLGTIFPNLQYSNCDANCLWDAWQAARQPKHMREEIVQELVEALEIARRTIWDDLGTEISEIEEALAKFKGKSDD